MSDSRIVSKDIRGMWVVKDANGNITGGPYPDKESARDSARQVRGFGPAAALPPKKKFSFWKGRG